MQKFTSKTTKHARRRMEKEGDKSDERRQAAEEIQAQWADGFRMIGEFLFEFSQLEFSIRFVLGHHLGLAEEYFDIVVGPYDFAMLCCVFRTKMTDVSGRT